MKSIKKFVLATGSAAITMLASASMVMAASISDTNITVGKGYAMSPTNLLSSITNIVMLIAAILVFAFMIMGGIQWITSGGDKAKAESARNKLTAAVIGLVIVAASYAILTLVLNFLGFDNLNSVFESVGTVNTIGG
jgi:heme/copper-type cytochrome/quinol oxidase subunit 2